MAAGGVVLRGYDVTGSGFVWQLAVLALQLEISLLLVLVLQSGWFKLVAWFTRKI